MDPSQHTGTKEQSRLSFSVQISVGEDQGGDYVNLLDQFDDDLKIILLHFLSYLQKWSTISDEDYVNLIDRFGDEFKKKLLHFVRKKVFFLHDNVWQTRVRSAIVSEYNSLVLFSVFKLWKMYRQMENSLQWRYCRLNKRQFWRHLMNEWLFGGIK